MEHIGRVKRWFEKGFGFIQGDNGSEVFVHFTHIKMEGFRVLQEGQTVKYMVVAGAKGPMATNVVLIERNQEVSHDTEDKAYWCQIGEKEEVAFVREIVPLINRELIKNPEKEEKSTAIDLIDSTTGQFADLKHQETPFFTAHQYGYNPQYTVTFNKKDYEYYSIEYPDAMIYWWINWRQLTWGDKKVNPLNGVWEVPFRQMKAKIEDPDNPAPLHAYQRRVNDPVNAKESYLFDLNTFTQLL